MVSLRLVPSVDPLVRERFATPEEHLKLIEVPSYGTVVLRNTSKEDRLIVPMHIGFFQPGAQNHATSRVLILEAGETLKATDCFCIQAAQGGLLKAAQQRFLMLPLGLRHQALAKRHTEGYARLWGDIDGYTRYHGVATGGHLERFLRPNFARLLPLRHALETVPGQIGAAYFVAGSTGRRRGRAPTRRTGSSSHPSWPCTATDRQRCWPKVVATNVSASRSTWMA